MGFEKLAEEKIREAMEAGEFDRLPNAGSPVDLESYFAMPGHLRMAYSILRNANCLPEEIHLLNEVARLERAVADATEREMQVRLSTELEAARLRLALALERLRSGSRPRSPR
jgi:hypothetical protein